MNKILLTSAAAIIAVIGNANADITTSNNSPDCDNTTLGVSSGSTNLEAQWQANTITLNWYDGDDKLTPTNSAAAGQCTYDGALTVPNDNLTKTGYTFDGWTVKAVVVNPFANFDVSLNGSIDYSNNAGYCRTHNASGIEGSISCSDASVSDLEYSEWKVVFDYATIKGTIACASNAAQGIPYGNGGRCWCTITEVDSQPVSSSWYFSGNNYAGGDCQMYCPKNCAGQVRSYTVARGTLYGYHQDVNTCTTLTDKNSCVSNVNYNQQYRWDYPQTCLWLNSTCYDRQVSDCSTITDSDLCNKSWEGGDFICSWNGESCYSYYDD